MIQQSVLDWTVDPPWDAREGKYESADGTIAGPFKESDVAWIIAFGSCMSQDWRARMRAQGRREFAGYDGDECGIAQLHDGRFVAWETWWGPTGSGFCCDAYGGDAIVMFGATLKAVIPHISEKARETLQWFDAMEVQP